MNPICKIWAHKYNDADEIIRCGIGRCAWCGFVLDLHSEDTDDESFNLAGKLWLKWTRFKEWFYRKTRYFRKCHDCGMRWGKHTRDCAPF